MVFSGIELIFVVDTHMMLCFGLEGTKPGQLTQAGQRDVPHHVPSCSTIKPGVKEEEEGYVPGDGVCLPKKPYV